MQRCEKGMVHNAEYLDLQPCVICITTIFSLVGRSPFLKARWLLSLSIPKDIYLHRLCRYQAVAQHSSPAKYMKAIMQSGFSRQIARRKAANRLTGLYHGQCAKYGLFSSSIGIIKRLCGISFLHFGIPSRSGDDGGVQKLLLLGNDILRIGRPRLIYRKNAISYPARLKQTISYPKLQFHTPPPIFRGYPEEYATVRRVLA